MSTVHEALEEARAADIESLDAQVMLSHVLKHERARLLAHPEARLDPAQAGKFREMVARRRRGEPVAYLVGQRAFYGLPFSVSPAVLIPRPETEHLVQAALEWAGPHQPLLAADVGTGSGVIAISLGVHLPDAHVVATDLSRAALAVAAQNAAAHGVRGRVELVQADLLAALAFPFDLIVSNPPYIATAELAGLEVARHEPRAALDGGPDGLVVIRRLLAEAPRLLARPGLLLVEMGAGQADTVKGLARDVFHDAEVSALRDYAGHERVLRVALGDGR